MGLEEEIAACRLCADRFAATATAHAPRPVAWFRAGAPIVIRGQAPGLRVQASGLPFDDASGARLRDWMGLEVEDFYDRDKVAFLPMGFCFPGYDAKGHDLPPPALRAKTWAARALSFVGAPRLMLLVGGAAMRWHFGRGAVAGFVADWRTHAANGIYPLPHPSWRNTGWLKRNPWFGQELVPELRAAVAAALETR